MKITVMNVSSTPHASFVYTGLYILESQKVVSLEWNAKETLYIPSEDIVEILIDGRCRIAFDLSDGYQHDIYKYKNYLKHIDRMYKRSCDSVRNVQLFGEDASKIRPFAFNYFVTCWGNPIDRKNGFTSNVTGFLRRLKNNNTVKHFEKKPVPYIKNQKPQIMFFCRLWDPNAQEIRQDAMLKEERNRINSMRIAIIRRLRELYPDNFKGGVERSSISERLCPDLILDEKETIKRHYLKQLRHADICIGSMGLHQSIGWKIAEYIAASKAIVAEKFCYEVVGNWTEGMNYIPFSTVEECIEGIDRLIKNPELLHDMQIANWK